MSVVMNEPLLRAAYTSSSARQAEPAFSEDPRDPGANVFVNGGFLVAALCAKSFVVATAGRRPSRPGATVEPRGLAVHHVAGST